jgi:hypothetical protein
MMAQMRSCEKRIQKSVDMKGEAEDIKIDGIDKTSGDARRSAIAQVRRRCPKPKKQTSVCRSIATKTALASRRLHPAQSSTDDVGT